MDLKGKKILVFVDQDYEDLELHYPRYRLKEARAEVIIAGSEVDKTYQGKKGYPCKPDLAIDQVKTADFSGLVIPGGYAPDKLRRLPRVLEITKELFDQGKLIAFICHAGWVPISAKIIKGVHCTSHAAIKDDMVNAGAHWVDEPVVVDKNVVSSRCPDDLPVFCVALLKVLSKLKID